MCGRLWKRSCFGVVVAVCNTGQCQWGRVRCLLPLLPVLLVVDSLAAFEGSWLNPNLEAPSPNSRAREILGVVMVVVLVVVVVVDVVVVVVVVNYWGGWVGGVEVVDLS